ncbi:unnamed protein product, partial [Ectocarpus fasciculatus]
PSPTDVRSIIYSLFLLMFLVVLGDEKVVVDLLRNGASPDMSREDGWAPLHAAARFGHASTAAALLTEGRADYEAVTEDHGSTPLHVAAISGFDEV